MAQEPAGRAGPPPHRRSGPARRSHGRRSGEAPFEAYGSDIEFPRREIRFLRQNLARFARPRRIRVGLRDGPGKAWLLPEPRGVVLLVGPWNSPVHLLIAPMADAIAAGNAVVAKPSELAPATSGVVADLVRAHLDRDAVSIVEGGAETAAALLEQRFDHILFTGSPRVGRVVAKAAYVLVERDVQARLLDAPGRRADDLLQRRPALQPRPGGDRQRRAHRSPRRTARGPRGRVVRGGQVDHERRVVAPTIIADPDPRSPLMQEEILGPVLPVLAVDDLEEAIVFVNDRPRPLALYVFSENEDTVRRIVGRTSSGGVCVNHTPDRVAGAALRWRR